MGLERRVLHPEGLTAESGRWSHAISVSVGAGQRLIFIAGQTARAPDGNPLHGADFQAQFMCVYESLKTVLRSAGASFSDVVSMRTYLTRREDLGTFGRLRNAAHGDLFPTGNYPPNTLVIVEGLAHPSLLLEVEAVAVASD